MNNDRHTKWKKNHGLKSISVAVYENELKTIKDIAKQEGLSAAKLMLNSVKEKYPEYFDKGGIK